MNNKHAIFPGIDPFVEAQGFWPDFHGSFMAYLRDYLLDHLPANYEARIDERFRVVERRSQKSRVREPDLAVMHHRAPGKSKRSGSTRGTVLLEPVTIPLVIEEETRESYIKIIWRPDRSTVTLIEILSPANKNKPGRDFYLGKRNEILRSSIHLVELDFLLGGRRMPLQQPYPPGDFHALVSHWEKRPDTDVYSWSIRDPLPTLPIPLRAPDQDLNVHFDRLYRHAFERGRYGRYIDYQKPLGLPLHEGAKPFLANLIKSPSHS